MKTIFIILMFCSPTLALLCQQMPVDTETGRITYTGVVNNDGASQNELYKAAKQWVLNAYHGCNIDQFNDDENATIVVNTTTTTFWNYSDAPSGYVHYQLTIACKDGRYKYTITNFWHEAPNDKPTLCDGGRLENVKYICPDLWQYNPPLIINKKDLWANIKKATNDKMLAIIANMKNAMGNTIVMK